MPSRRDALLIIAAAVVLALLAWVLLTSGSSDAPGSEPGARNSAHMQPWDLEIARDRTYILFAWDV